METYNSIPNVNETNTIFRYEVSSQIHDIIIPIGAYELSQINGVIQKKLLNQNVFELLANKNTQKGIIRIVEMIRRLKLISTIRDR